MIRRHVGNEIWLIAQHDHAILSGQLAEQLGANGFAAPDPSTILGIGLHDCGWPLHDENPTLNAQGQPLDVFEATRDVAMMVWPASAQRAAERDRYAGLLVSLHSLSLSVMSTNPTAFVHEKFDMSDRSNRFEVNKFQQGQIELQEKLRGRLGMRIDEPRHFGLAEQSSDPREKQLTFDFRLLQAMDKLSLNICCTNPPAKTIEPLLTSPNGADRPLHFARHSDWQMSVDPWPFKLDRLALSVPFRRFAEERFSSEQEFRDAYHAAPIERFEFQLSPHSS